MKHGFCDFRCWEAKGPICRCWCGGVNHGVYHKLDDEEYLKEHPELRPFKYLVKHPTIKKYGITEYQYERFLLARNKGPKEVELEIEAIVEELLAEF